MTIQEENKAIFSRVIEEIWNQGKLDVADELFAVDHRSPVAPNLPPGPEGVKILVRMFRQAFPDFWMRIECLVAEGDKVAARYIQGGTHQGELMGIAATGKKATWTEIGILQIVNGKIVESWYEVDMLGLMQQLGAIPPN